MVHNLLSVVAEISPIWGSVVVVSFSEDENVVAATERVFEDGSWAEVDI